MSLSKRCYYEVLQLRRPSNGDEIKKSFRKLAIKWHPDKNPDNKESASQKFRQLSEAYECLSDEAKKKEYDMYGHGGPKKTSFSTYSSTRADDLFKTFFSQSGFDSATDQEMFSRRYGPTTFTRRDFGSMGSNYDDILRNLSSGQTKFNYSKSGSYGGTGSGGASSYSSYGTTGGTTAGKSSSSSYATSGNTFTANGKTYVRVNSTGGYGSYGFGGGGGGTVIGGDEEVTKETVRNKWANRFDDPQESQPTQSQPQQQSETKPQTTKTPATSSTSLSQDGTTRVQTTVSIMQIQK